VGKERPTVAWLGRSHSRIALPIRTICAEYYQVAAQAEDGGSAGQRERRIVEAREAGKSLRSGIFATTVLFCQPCSSCGTAGQV